MRYLFQILATPLQRLIKIFASRKNSFRGLPVIFCGDLYQPPPVKGSPIHTAKSSIKGLITLKFWRLLKIGEITEVMRLGGDKKFIMLLLKILESDIDESLETVLRSRFMNVLPMVLTKVRNDLKQTKTI